MASSSPQTDQMDEEFFDRLVEEDDYGAAQPSSEHEEMVRVLSNFSLGEVEYFGSASEVNELKDNDFIVNTFEASESNASAEEKSEVLIEGAAGGAKGTSVKEIEWSAFRVDSLQFGQGEFESDLFMGNGYGMLAEPDDFSQSKSTVIENTAKSLSLQTGSYEQHNAQVCSSVSEISTADLTKMQNWENVYPGWKYDSIAGKWHQIDGYNSTTDTHDTFNTAGGSTHEKSQAKVLSTFNGSLLEVAEADENLHQTNHSVLEMILEENNMANNKNQVSQESINYPQTNHLVLETIPRETNIANDKIQLSQENVNYPPNMVFDPQYPEWYYDTITQIWCTLESYQHTLHHPSNATQGTLANNMNALTKDQNTFEVSLSDISDHVNSQHSHTVFETISEGRSGVSNNKQASQDSIEYPPNIVFDPQYPEWYYDTITQMWYTLESYNQAFHNPSNTTQDILTNNANSLAELNVDHHAQSGHYTLMEQSSTKSYQNASSSGQEGHWNVSGSGCDPPSMLQERTNKESNSRAFGNGYNQQNAHKPEFLIKSESAACYSNNHMAGRFYGSPEYTGNYPDNQLDSFNLEPTVKHNYSESNMAASRSNAMLESTHNVNQPNIEQSLSAHISYNNFDTESSIHYSQQPFLGANLSYSQFSYTPKEGRSAAGRPPHTLVTFGFGGKILVMNDASLSSSSFASGSLGTVGGVVSIHSLADVVMTKADILNTPASSGFSYFHSLCREAFPGPLVGGNAASKDINKWINDKIMTSESSNMEFQNGSLLRLLFSLLKILCQYHGKLRSPYDLKSSHEGSDVPESAVSKLFASAKMTDAPFNGFSSSMHCMKNLPSEGNIMDTATEVQNLLVSGRRKEALERAQEGQLWGTAVVLAAQLGEQFYADTVKQMALRQFVCGSPLRTLHLLIARRPADVFSADSSSIGSPGVPNGLYHSSEILPKNMLDEWKENLAIITSNRTNDDELVIIHLGDCLWKEREEVAAAHICYLLAEANFEPYSSSSRLCLIGADHCKNPRTFACPYSIQRTEIYEYSKVIGNSQFVLLPFQPYKLVYAYMLAEMGKMSDSLRYCQASLKILKNSGRSSEVELWRTLFSSLEERLRAHQQVGYSVNLAPAKLVGKLFSSIDRSIHRMIGVPPLPPSQRNTGDGIDGNASIVQQNLSTSQSAAAISSLMVDSSSTEAMGNWAAGGGGWKTATPSRSISEPDFGRSPKRNASKEDGGGPPAPLGGPSRFGRFGSQLFQKTIGLVSWSRHDRQAKLGESNKFYYNEKLKRWVEEGAELPAAEAALPPPPPMVAPKSHSEETKADSPPELAFGRNQFSARDNKLGVRSRYVDTFNKGSGSFAGAFRPPSIPPAKHFSGAGFFVPSADTPSTSSSLMPSSSSPANGGGVLFAGAYESSDGGPTADDDLQEVEL